MHYYAKTASLASLKVSTRGVAVSALRALDVEPWHA